MHDLSNPIFWKTCLLKFDQKEQKITVNTELPFKVGFLGGVVGFWVTTGFSGFFGTEGLGFLATGGGLKQKRKYYQTHSKKTYGKCPKISNTLFHTILA